MYSRFSGRCFFSIPSVFWDLKCWKLTNKIIWNFHSPWWHAIAERVWGRVALFSLSNAARPYLLPCIHLYVPCDYIVHDLSLYGLSVLLDVWLWVGEGEMVLVIARAGTAHFGQQKPNMLYSYGNGMHSNNLILDRVVSTSAGSQYQRWQVRSPRIISASLTWRQLRWEFSSSQNLSFTMLVFVIVSTWVLILCVTGVDWQ